ncbi:hypothetical protein [Streptomyces virginiae]|uniref:hypothetical protein n=1 Tax=Streptomyces virginiae TaxID=1961 RepID=UPI0036FB5093
MPGDDADVAAASRAAVRERVRCALPRRGLPRTPFPTGDTGLARIAAGVPAAASGG